MMQERNGVRVCVVQICGVKRRRNIVWDAATDQLAVDLAHKRKVSVSRLLEELVAVEVGAPADRVTAPGSSPSNVVQEYIHSEMRRMVAESRYRGPRGKRRGK